MTYTYSIIKDHFITIITLFIFLIISSCGGSKKKVIGNGLQPQMAIDKSGTIRIIFGEKDKIYCATSKDSGNSFPDIQQVGEVREMHLGMSRGPQVASSNDYTMIAAVDKKGMIHTFLLNHDTGKWHKASMINDIEYSAPEGLMSIASDQRNCFYAVWLDIRQDKHNKICFAATLNLGRNWSKNQIVYKSPDSTVCECCKPNITVNRTKIFIMFRNWLNGSRDLYLMTGDKKNERFDKPTKLGFGTWVLNACPMDGGGLIHTGEKIITVWQRDGKIYLASPDNPEKKLGTGRNCSITDPRNPIITWQEGEKLKLHILSIRKTIDVGRGSFLKAMETMNGNILCTWEDDDEIIVKQIKL